MKRQRKERKDKEKTKNRKERERALLHPPAKRSIRQEKKEIWKKRDSPSAKGRRWGVRGSDPIIKHPWISSCIRISARREIWPFREPSSHIEKA